MNFIFGGDTGVSYEDIQRKRRLAQEIARSSMRTPRNVGEGIASIGRALEGRALDKKIAEGQAELDAEADAIWGRIGGGMFGDAGRFSTSGALAGVPARRVPMPELGNVDDADPRRGAMPTGPSAPERDLWADQKDVQAGIFAGESGGDYDALFGFQNRPGGRYANVKPTEMTVGEVAQFQDPQGEYGQWVKGQVGRVATPVGAYQVVGTTLRDAIRAGVVDPNEKFGRQTQDKVGRWVLSTQGTGAWEGYRGPGGGSGAYMPGGGNMLTTEALIAAMGNRTLMERPGAAAVVNALLQQNMRQSDPMYQLQMRQAQAELNRAPERQTARDVNGILRYTDTGEQVFSDVTPASDPETTGDYANYLAEKAAGNIAEDVSYTDWKRDNTAAGAARTEIITNLGGTGFGSETFEAMYDDITKEARSAGEMSGMLDTVELALDTGLETGPTGEALLRLRRLGDAIGVDVDTTKMAGAEMLKAVTNRMALLMRNPDSGMGMPGAVSDRDLTFLKEAQVGLDRSPTGNRKMLQAFKALNQRKIEISRMADAYLNANGRLDTGFKQQVREYAKANPLYSPDFFSNLEEESGSVPTPEPSPSAAPPEWMLMTDPSTWTEEQMLEAEKFWGDGNG